MLLHYHSRDSNGSKALSNLASSKASNSASIHSPSASTSSASACTTCSDSVGSVSNNGVDADSLVRAEKGPLSRVRDVLKDRWDRMEGLTWGIL